MSNTKTKTRFLRLTYNQLIDAKWHLTDQIKQERARLSAGKNGGFLAELIVERAQLTAQIKALDDQINAVAMKVICKK